MSFISLSLKTIFRGRPAEPDHIVLTSAVMLRGKDCTCGQWRSATLISNKETNFTTR